jgi:NAD(P)-dependent dehydrogenase (short-subunit alcohol dehydrogenase family)
MKKNILITGATGNLGQACVRRFIQEGYQVIVTIPPDETFSFNETVTTFKANLKDEHSAREALHTILERHKTVHAALLLVGGFAMGSIKDTDSTLLKSMISLNFETAYHVVRPVFQHMAEQGYGRIVLVGARPALNPADGKNMLAYALSKSMLFKLAEFLNAEGAERGVVTSVVVPSIIDTEANRKAMPTANVDGWVKPEEIANALVYLCSENGKALREPILKLYGHV